MAFHPIDRGPNYGSLTPPAERRISARVSLHNGKPRVNFRITRDALSHLGLGIGDYIVIMVGSDEDFGAFAVQRGNRNNGYRIGAYANGSRLLAFNLAASRFMPLPEKTTVHYRLDFENEPRRVIARPAVFDMPNARVNVTPRASVALSEKAI